MGEVILDVHCVGIETTVACNWNENISQLFAFIVHTHANSFIQCHTGSSTCTVCENTTFTNSTKSSQCAQCVQCESGKFIYQPCSTVSNTDCRPFQYDIPQTGKIVIVFLPVVFLILALIVSYVVTQKMVFNSVWPSFIGANDSFSDWMLLVLIEPSNPWMIFWVALSSLLLSTAASLAIALWFARNTESNPAYVIWLCLTSSTETLKQEYQNRDDNSEEKVLFKKLHKFNENVFSPLRSWPMIAVQIILYSAPSSEIQIVDWILMAEVIICKIVFVTVWRSHYLVWQATLFSAIKNGIRISRLLRSIRKVQTSTDTRPKGCLATAKLVYKKYSTDSQG